MMKTYWQGEILRGPAYGDSRYVGTLIVENDGVEPDWVDLGYQVFGGESIEVRLPVRKSLHVDDRILGQKPRLHDPAYQVWAIHPLGGYPDSAVTEDE